MDDQAPRQGHNSGQQARNEIVVRLPGVLVDLFPGAPRRLELDADSVQDMVNELNSRWPGMRDRICDSSPAIRKHMNVFVDGERVHAEPLADGSTVTMGRTRIIVRTGAR